MCQSSIVFGRQIALKANQTLGQDGTPLKVVSYSTYGIPQGLAIYRNSEPKPAWCFEGLSP
jgi:hypothetical protein